MDDMLQFRPEEQTQAQLTSLQAANGDAEMLSPRAASPALQHVSDTSPEEVSPLPKAPPPQNAHETRDSPKPRDVTASAACLTCVSRSTGGVAMRSLVHLILVNLDTNVSLAQQTSKVRRPESLWTLPAFCFKMRLCGFPQRP